MLETTNYCDGSCVMCPREEVDQPPREMDMGLYRKVIDDVSQYGVGCVDLGGYGDCLLDSRLFKRLAYLREKLPQTSTFITTTGFRLTPDKWRDVLEYVDTIRFSIHGFTEGTYEKVHRGAVKYYEVMENIQGFLEFIKDKRELYDIHTIGTCVVNALNRHELEAWLNHWRPRFDEVLVWKPHNWVNGRSYRKVDRSNQRSCGRPINGPLYIHADGIVSACCLDIHKELVVGDMKSQTIQEVLDGWPYRSVRDSHIEGRFENSICRDCDQTNYDPDVLLYASNSNRKVGQIIADGKMVYGEV